MKNHLLTFVFSVILTLNCVPVSAQVAINTDGSQPVSSAGLDVKFNNKGFLPPRLTRSELPTIPNPADGLVVYCTDCGTDDLGALSIFMSGSWYILNASCLEPLTPMAATHIPSSTQIVWKWRKVANAIGYKWGTSIDYMYAMDMGADTTTTETGLTCWTSYTRYVWAYSACGHSFTGGLSQKTLPVQFYPAPTEGSHGATTCAIAWNWNPVSGATGYKWSKVNNFETATDLGNVTTKLETGAGGNTMYTRYIWSYNACGYSSATTITYYQSIPGYCIGQSYGGGIIYYIDGTGQHGLIAATSDIGSAQWGCLGTSVNYTGNAIGTGKTNTTKIVNGCPEAGNAARICDELVLNGYSDWFLPSKDELNQMYLQKSVIGGFTSSYYWTSSESITGYASFQDFSNGTQLGCAHWYGNRVRPSREF